MPTNPVNSYIPITYPALMVNGQDYTTREDGNFPGQDNGVYVSASGAFFFVLIYQPSGSSSSITVFRSTNSGLNWTECDISNRKLIGRTATGSQAPWSVYRDGDILYFAHSATLVIDQFNMATSLWGSQIASGGPVQDKATFTAYTGYVHTFLTKRGSDYVILYQTKDTVSGFTYARCKVAVWNGSTWTTQNVGNGTTSTFFAETPCGILLGSGNRIHLFFVSDEISIDCRVQQRTLNASNVLQTLQVIDTDFEIPPSAVGTASYNVVATPRLKVNEIFLVYYRKNINSTLSHIGFLKATSADNPLWTSEPIPDTTFYSNISNYGIRATSGTIVGHVLSTSNGARAFGVVISTNYDYQIGPNGASEHQIFLRLPIADGLDDDFYVFWLHERSDTSSPYVYTRRRSDTGYWDAPREFYYIQRATSICAAPIESSACPDVGEEINVMY